MESCNLKPQRLKDSKIKRLFSSGAILLIVFCAACGKHKTQVKVPQPPRPATSPVQKTETAKQQAPAPSLPPARGIKQAAPAAEPSPAPEVEAVAPASETPPGPPIRIGLITTAREIRISSSGDYYLMEKKPEASRELVQGEIQVRVEQEIDETDSVYQIQVASFLKLENAEDLREKLAGRFDSPVAIHENSDTGTHQVRVGEFLSKEEAQEFLKTLLESGYRGAFIVRETVSTGGGKAALAVHGPGNLFRLSRSGFLFMPSSGTNFLRVGGKQYRGFFDVFLNDSNRITVVNQVGTEEYLLGVVPAEMNPTAYPEYAGLAALSIAARTYALKNMGRYRSEGYDLSDDTRTQVYSGVDGERAAASDAVRRTYGLAIFYSDQLIDAMHMSTCGGRTEDFSNVFDAPPVPYLKSVVCANEDGPEKGETVIEGGHELEQVFLADDGSVANRDLEFASVLGLTGSDSEPDFFAGPAKRDEIIRWVETAGKIAQKAFPRNLSIAGIDTRAGFLRYAAESFFGADQIRQRISIRDVEYYIGNLKDGDSAPEPVRYALAYLLQNKLWRPYSDNTVRPDAPIRRGDAISLLLRLIESARPGILRKGTFMGASPPENGSTPDSSISVKWGNKTQEFRLSQKPYIFRRDPGRMTPVSQLRLIGNEKIAFHVAASGAIDFLEIELSPAGASSDRYSPSATWEVTIARSTVAEKLRSLAGNIGELRDLKPARIGNSGRVVQIEAIGSRTSVVLNGYKVRNALGLKDTLFKLSREYNPDGSIAAFTFNGRGYGHGVGLCQVGAFGMARAGRSYEEILKTYYQGVQIKKAY